MKVPTSKSAPPVSAGAPAIDPSIAAAAPAGPLPFGTLNREAFIDFTTQACAGPLMGLVRIPAMRGRVSLKVMLAQYLNSCYLNLMRQDDAFVVDAFAAFNDSPVCAMHRILAIGDAAFLTVDEVVDLVNAAQGDSEEARIAWVRSSLHRILRGRVTRALEAMLATNGADHVCTGHTAAQLREEWVAEGSSPEYQMFTVK